MHVLIVMHYIIKASLLYNFDTTKGQKALSELNTSHSSLDIATIIKDYSVSNTKLLCAQLMKHA